MDIKLMKQSIDTDKKIEEDIIAYIYKSCLNKKEEDAFRNLLISNVSIAEKVYKKLNHVKKDRILVHLNSEGKGVELAKQKAIQWAGCFTLVNCTPLEKKEFRSWLAGETDTLPKIMPKNDSPIWYGYLTNVTLCYMSMVCTFTERLCVYGIVSGYVDIAKEPVKEMMRCISVEYATMFLDNVINNYGLTKKDIMQMFSVIYAGARKTKLEEEYYSKYVVTWIKEDKEEYINAISSISKDARDSVFKKLKKVNLYDPNLR